MPTDDRVVSGWRPLRPPGRASLEPSPFSRLAVAHALSVAGDALVTMALAGSLFFSISPSAARGRVGLSLLLTVAPFGLVAPFLGPAIDRRPGGRRAMVFVVAAARAVTALYMASVIDRLLLFPAAFVYLVLSKTHAVAKSALVPGVVESDEELVRANSRLALLGVVMGFVAAIPAVPILKWAGGEWVLRLAALVFAAGAVAALRITQAREDRTARAVHLFGRDRGPGRDEDGQSHVAAAAVRERGIRAAAIAMGGLRAGVGFLTFLVAFALRRGDAPSWVFGAALAASMGGTLIGAAVAPRLRQSFNEERLIAGSLALVAVVGFVATRMHGRQGAALMAAGLGLAASAGKLAFDALVQRDAPGAVRGRQFARFEAAFQLAWVAGAIVPVVIPMPTRFGAAMLGAGALALGVTYVSGTRGTGPVPP